MNGANMMRGTNGIIEGRALNMHSKEPLQAVNIIILGTNYGAATDSEGYFQINYVRAGVYDVRFSLIGYTTIIMKKVTILPDVRNRLDAELEPSAVELGAVEVYPERPLIQKDQPATAFAISEVKLEKLPISTFQEAVTLQPGTTSEGNIRGGRTQEVVYLVDGLPVQDVIGGGLGTNLPKTSITALTIYTGGFEAEYGNALSGVVNVVTKTGGNRQTLGVRAERDSWLPHAWNEQQNRETELELTANGPIVPDRLTYFTAHTATLTDTRWWQDFRNFFRSPLDQEFSGLGKIEYAATPEMKVNFHGIYSVHKWHDYEFSWRYNLNGLPSRRRDAYRVAVNLSQSLSEHSFYTASLSAFSVQSRIGEGAKTDLTLQPYEYDFFLRYVISGQRSWWADTRQMVYTAKGDFTSQIGKEHLLKAGIELNQYDIFSDLVKYEPQKTYFGKPIPDAPMLNYSNSYDYRPRSGNLFLQDKIQFQRDGSNVSLGVRWDFLDPRAERPIVEFVPTNPNEFQEHITGTAKASFKQQFSPRIAFAAPIGLASFFFVNYGHYFQFPLFDYLYSGINPEQLRGGVKNVLTGNPDLEPERTKAWEIGFKYGIKENMVASATYFQKRTENQIDAKTLVPFDSKFAGDYGFASYVNNAEAIARGFEVVFIRERDDRLSGSISYTYMTTEGLSEYIDQRINLAQWGFPIAPTTFPLSWDQRHTVKVDAESKLPGGIQTNLILLYNSPRPYTYFPSRDGFTAADTSQVFVPNNARMLDVTVINLKISKEVLLNEGGGPTVSIYADVRNLMNTANVKWIDSNGRIGGELSDPGAYYEPRRIRIGARIEF